MGPSALRVCLTHVAAAAFVRPGHFFILPCFIHIHIVAFLIIDTAIAFMMGVEP